MDKNGWNEITSDINNISKKIKEKVSNEDIVGDLKDSLNSTVESASQILKNISNTVQKTVSFAGEINKVSSFFLLLAFCNLLLLVLFLGFLKIAFF